MELELLIRRQSDLDSVPDPVDPTSGWQLSCGKFFPFAIKNDASEATRLVVVSQYPLNASKMTFYDKRAELLGAPIGEGGIKSFQEATLGRGTMDTTSPFAASALTLSGGFESNVP
jgi:hypothetical protein